MIYTITKSIVFHFLWGIWTIFIGILLIPYIFLPARYIYKPTHIWIKGVFLLLKTICDLDYKIIGQNYFKENNIKIIASKHQSTFETLLFFLIIPKCIFIHKYELFYIPIFGFYLKKMNMISIDRSANIKAMKKVLDESKQKVNNGHTLIIFPEGTRKLPGSKPDYKSGVAGIYEKINSDVLPVTLNSGLFWNKYSYIIKPGKIIVKFLPPIKKGLSKKNFLEKLENQIEEKN
tara:strand:+ start:3039 stop:3737 length:699 start_codon:yes stop_codon:yes gene_type:complete